MICADRSGDRIIPANPKYYDIEHAFDDENEIDWKQGAGIKVGDTVFMYVASPVSAILYKCKVTETDIPYKYADENLTISALMKIKLLKRYKPEKFTFDVLKEEHGMPSADMYIPLSGAVPLCVSGQTMIV